MTRCAAVFLTLVLVVGSACLEHVGRLGQSPAAAETAGEIARQTVGDSAPVRALWVWDARVVTDQAAREALLAFCRENGIGLIFVDVGSMFVEPDSVTWKPPVTADQLAEFASAAHNAGLVLHALDGDATWSRVGEHDIAIGRLERALAFNSSRQEESERLDGFQFDIEPHTLAGIVVGSSEWHGTLGEYLDLVDRLADTVGNGSRRFELGFAVPFWWDEENTEASVVTWNGTAIPIAQHLINRLSSLPRSYLAIMAYRDEAGGMDGSVAHSEHEVAYADRAGSRVQIYVGQETAEVAGEPEKITFWQEGQGALDEAVAEIEAAFRAHTSFAGVAIHHYDSYRNLVERGNVGPEIPTLRIEFSAVPPAGGGGGSRGNIAGRLVGVSEPEDCKVVLYAHTDCWYVQPLIDYPLTNVASDGTWANWTHLGDRYAALVVRPAFQPPALIQALPAVGGSVLAVAEIPAESNP